ncbi:MAG: hypothetical protein EZS28_038853, partial [Streblomastix strix]
STDWCAISSLLPHAQGESEFEIPQRSETGQVKTMQALIDLEDNFKAIDSQREGGVESVDREHERKMK